MIALLLGFLVQTWCMYYKGGPNLDTLSYSRLEALSIAPPGLQSLHDLGLTQLSESKHGLRQSCRWSATTSGMAAIWLDGVRPGPG